MRLRWIVYVAIAAVVLTGGGFAAFKLSPWPSVLLVRYAFDKDSAARNQALEKHVPANVTELLDQSYGPASTNKLDVFFPTDAGTGGTALPTVVWIHGGAFIAGQKADVAPYLKIVAGRGYTVIGVGYSIAPGAQYPTPVIEANEALAYVLANARQLHVDPARLFLAGDSAGAQIAAQLAATISDPDYAKAVGIEPAIERRQLSGVVLLCGVYDTSIVDFNGDFGGFLRTVMWSYFGTGDFDSDPRVAQFSVSRHLTPSFPPAFLSVGNADPLKPQTLLMTQSLKTRGIPVDTLFFDDDHQPPLAHEYQFDLDGEAGQQAFERLTAFLAVAKGGS